ncbi:hypothetical protein V8G54_018725 [Vigna mungo]|uniref:Aluminum-activated malate transporter n=1 Tax=Vigna mungo TaxID=3915 RepID=A0AAQ3RRR0_VIGMU
MEHLLENTLTVTFPLTLVSLIYYLRPLYDGFRVAGMWAVLTVVVVFEFSVGATLCKSLNRGCATLLAGALGVGGQHLASAFGQREKPIILGILVFILVVCVFPTAGATFFRFFPKIKARYDYGLVIFILTFCLVVVSGYRVEELIELAHQRLSTILIGVTACMDISIFICPVWAGEDLHKLVASNIEKLSNYLQGFEVEYFHCSEEKEKCEKSVLEGYKIALNSKASEESLANLARWKPGHGRFPLRHPWTQYLKIGTLIRECAYKIETLNNYLNPEIPCVVEPSVSPEKPHLLHRGIIKPVVDIENTIEHIAILDNHIFAKKGKENNKALWTYVNSCHLLETSITSLLNFLFLRLTSLPSNFPLFSLCVRAGGLAGVRACIIEYWNTYSGMRLQD